MDQPSVSLDSILQEVQQAIHTIPTVHRSPTLQDPFYIPEHVPSPPLIPFLFDLNLESSEDQGESVPSSPDISPEVETVPRSTSPAIIEQEYTHPRNESPKPFPRESSIAIPVLPPPTILPAGRVTENQILFRQTTLPEALGPLRPHRVCDAQGGIIRGGFWFQSPHSSQIQRSSRHWGTCRSVQRVMKRLLVDPPVQRLPHQAIYSPSEDPHAPAYIVDYCGQVLANFNDENPNQVGTLPTGALSQPTASDSQPGSGPQATTRSTWTVDLCKDFSDIESDEPTYTGSGMDGDDAVMSGSEDLATLWDMVASDDSDLEPVYSTTPKPIQRSSASTTDTIRYTSVPSQKLLDRFQAVTAQDDRPKLESAVSPKTKEDDSVLPLYGESDYDTDELSESDFINESNADPSGKKPKVSAISAEAQEKVVTFVNNYLEKLRDEWRTTKLPALEARAWHNWHQQKSRKEGMAAEKEDLENRRLPKQHTTIVETGITSERKLTRLCTALTETVYRICQLEWLLELVEKPCPEPPTVVRKRTAKRKSREAELFHTLADGGAMNAAKSESKTNPSSTNQPTNDDDLTEPVTMDISEDDMADFIDDSDLTAEDRERYSHYYEKNIHAPQRMRDDMSTPTQGPSTKRATSPATGLKTSNPTPRKGPDEGDQQVSEKEEFIVLAKGTVNSPRSAVHSPPGTTSIPAADNDESLEKGEEPMGISVTPEVHFIAKDEDVIDQPESQSEEPDPLMHNVVTAGLSTEDQPRAMTSEPSSPQLSQTMSPDSSSSVIIIDDQNDTQSSPGRSPDPDDNQPEVEGVPSPPSQTGSDVCVIDANSFNEAVQGRTSLNRRVTGQSLFGQMKPEPVESQGLDATSAQGDQRVPTTSVPQKNTQPPSSSGPVETANTDGGPPLHVPGDHATLYPLELMQAMVTEFTPETLTACFKNLLRQEACQVPPSHDDEYAYTPLNRTDKECALRIYHCFYKFTKWRIQSREPLLAMVQRFYSYVCRLYSLKALGSDTSHKAQPVEEETEVDSAPQVGRKNIRKIKGEEADAIQLRKKLQQQEKEWQQRVQSTLKRVTKKAISPSLSNTNKVLTEVQGDAVLINVGHPESDSDVFVAPFLAQHLKPHQIEGVQFMWKNMVTFSGRGCILAHAMGLGKTFQVITFLYTLLQEIVNRNPAIPAHMRSRRVLVLCPPTIKQNWLNEIHQWIPSAELTRVVGKLYTMDNSLRTVKQRLEYLQDWYVQGGILLAGYQSFRDWATGGSALSKIPHTPDEVAQFQKLLLDPGPAVVIADEGHKIKNPNARLSVVSKMLRTTSRVCLTGYPLQNKLEEYWCMVDFIYPGYLGTIGNFRNAYINPINNGLFPDSTRADRKICQQRLYVLQDILADVVQRREIQQMYKELPPKREFVITCSLTDVQYNMYTEVLMHELSQSNGVKSTSGLLAMEHLLRSICNHPYICYFLLQQRYRDLLPPAQRVNSANVLASGTSLSSLFANVKLPPVLRTASPSGRGNSGGNSPSVGGTDDDLDGMQDPAELASANMPIVPAVVKIMETILNKVDNKMAPELSNKMVVLLRIVRMCQQKREKVLVFTRSIPTIYFLEHLFKQGPNRIKALRLDGATPMQNRQALVDTFNKDWSYTVFLMSSGAGSLGLNITSANRVILVDVGWNPSFDEQAVARAYRYGQTKPVFVYRLSSCGTLEDKIFKNNIHKEGLSKRVVDQRNVEKHFTKLQLKSYWAVPPQDPPSLLPIKRHSLPLDQDDILKNIVDGFTDNIVDIIEKSFYLHEDYEVMSEEHQREAHEFLRMERDRISGKPTPPLASDVPTFPTPELVSTSISGGTSASAMPNRAPESTTALTLMGGTAPANFRLSTDHATTISSFAGIQTSGNQNQSLYQQPPQPFLGSLTSSSSNPNIHP
ncbi:hypothetical protein IWQ62_003357 [Dispira parvispora]|uniref:Uncharacterized protein n=1 Tax=Dispira parvispora TaxID=1520584 RepID=A0A9W8E2Z7_9FUNG|nr:hypothetical protein IWQ62_003357 [Dispira parvispora]